jgi:GTPase SAR1 family protein
MSTSPTAPAPDFANLVADPAALRVVLFGMPDAGKSSLLGALVQATQTQDRALDGRLLDLTHGLGELWRRVYEDRQRETLEEIVPHPIVFEPYPGDPSDTPRLNAVLYDCDGRAANELLSQRRALENEDRPGSLATAVLDADALILTIDGSASDEQLETDFREFVRFLRMLEERRGHARDVGGLPVFLTLTKCDLLARGPISRGEWERRVAQRKEQLGERFTRYLEGNAESGAMLGFGSLDVHVATTAVRRPALADAPAMPREPLGVAELFHDCLRSAYRFQRREQSANRRLRWTLAGAGGFIATAAILSAFWLALGGPAPKPLDLLDRIERFQASEKPLPDRLANELLRGRQAELNDLRDNPQFKQLPDDKQSFVRGRIDELQDYLRFRERLAQIADSNRARNLAQLKQIEQQLRTEAAVPEKYRAEWPKTPAVLERARRLGECETIRTAVDAELRPFFLVLRNKGNDLLFAKELDPRWEEKANAVLAMEAKPPFARTEPIKGTAYEFDETLLDEKEWLNVRLRLTHVRDLALALGLIGDPENGAAVLAIPAAMIDVDLNTFCASRLERLQRLYPSYKHWTLAQIPEDIRGQLRRKLARSLDQMTRDGQRLILAKYRQIQPSGADTLNEWHEIAVWLLRPELQQWRELIGLLAKLIDPTSSPPVPAAAEFLQKKSFEVQIKALTLSIPNNLPPGPSTPGDVLQVHWRPQGIDTARTSLPFQIKKAETKENAREKTYRFELAKGDGRLTFKPGDEFDAELRLTKDDKAWQLTWRNARTAAYAFEALRREPVLHAVGPSNRGMTADGVSLTIEGQFPNVPDLIPNVRRESK